MKLTLWTSFLIVLVFHAFSGVDAWASRTLVQDLNNGAVEVSVAPFVAYCFDYSNGGVTAVFAYTQITAFVGGKNDQTLTTDVEDLPVVKAYSKATNAISNFCLTAAQGQSAIQISYAADDRLSENEVPAGNFYSMKITGRDINLAADFADLQQKIKDAELWDTADDSIVAVVEFADYTLLAIAKN